VPPNFYNLRDQAIYSAGDFFIPQEKYRAAPYNVNTPTAPDDPAAAGIPAVYQAQGGGGGGTYTGGISDLTGDFFKTTSDRQNRLTELNRPMGIIPGQTGDEIIMERLAPYGAPKDFYEGSIEGIPQTIKGAPGIFTREEPTIGRKIQDAFYSLPFLSKPQSADQILAEGYTGKVGGPGILGMMAGMVDRYGDLPRGDQAFIARNMGYTGPTVFGENTSGLSKDVFGLNTRSAFGNYAERVGKEVDKLGFALSDAGKTGSKYDATFNPETGLFEGPEADKANYMTKMMRAKLGFYKKQTLQRDADREADAQRIRDELAAAAAAKDKAAALAAIKAQGKANYTPSIHGPTNYGQDSQGNQSFDFGGGFGIGSDGGPVSNRTGRGRQGYMDGGIVDMLEIYD
jgi:hypothetical protein